ncbi:MAG TPA: DUF2058 family protein [Rudaea sp.]
MAESLRDQLLKSGLVKQLKAQEKPARDKPRHAPQQHHHKKPAPPSKPQPQPQPQSRPQVPTEPDLARAYALRARQEKEERDRAQREAERQAREKKERKARLTALLDGKARNAADADVPRHFPHGNKIRRVYVTADQLKQVNRGELAVVQLAGRYLIVERDVALQAQAIQEECLVLLCDPNAPAEDDVPADLIW